MKRGLVVALMLTLAGSAFAGTAVFNGITGSPPFASNAAPVFHPLLTAAANTAGYGSDLFGITATPATGWRVTNLALSTNWCLALSKTGGTANADLFAMGANDPWQIVYKFKPTVMTGPTGSQLRLSFSITYNSSFGATNNINFEGSQHEGHKNGIEFQGQSTIPGLQLRMWDEGLLGFYTVNPSLTWGGLAHNLASANANRVDWAQVANKEWTVRITRDASANIAFYLTISGYTEFATEKLIVTIPASVAALKGDGTGATAGDVPHIRFRADLVDFNVVATGASVEDVNADLLGAEGVPSLATPFFAQ